MDLAVLSLEIHLGRSKLRLECLALEFLTLDEWWISLGSVLPEPELVSLPFLQSWLIIKVLEVFNEPANPFPFFGLSSQGVGHFSLGSWGQEACGDL